MGTQHIFSALVVLLPIFLHFEATTAQVCRPHCGINAECTADGCRCSADYPSGHPLFMCHPDTSASCFLIGDPKCRGFSGDETRINHPCKTTLTHFDTPLQGAPVGTMVEPGSLTLAGNNNCRVIVDGTNNVTRSGEYYVDAVDIYITITRDQREETAAIRLARGSYRFDVNGQQFLELDQSDCVAISVNDRTIPTCFRSATKMWVIDAAVCGETEIRFREWDLSVENQLDRAGVGIVTLKSNGFDPTVSGYPNTICDYPGGSPNVYKNYYRGIGIRGRHLANLQAFLSWPPIFGQPTTHTHCTVAVDAYRNCPPGRRVRAVNVCGRLVNRNPLCSLRSGLEIMYTFTQCLNGACSRTQRMCDNILTMVAPRCPRYSRFRCNY